MKGIKSLRRCEICNRHFFKLHIHHINGDHSNNKEKNLIILCIDCHMTIHNGFGYKIYYRGLSTKFNLLPEQTKNLLLNNLFNDQSIRKTKSNHKKIRTYANEPNIRHKLIKFQNLLIKDN